MRLRLSFGRWLAVSLMVVFQPFVASGQETVPAELRLQEVLERQDRQAESILLEAQEAYVLLSAPARDGIPLSELADSLFTVLPQGVGRLWLSWPGVQAREARLFWRGAPIRSKATQLLGQAGDEDGAMMALRVDPCGGLRAEKSTDPTHGCETGALRFTGPSPYD